MEIWVDRGMVMMELAAEEVVRLGIALEAGLDNYSRDDAYPRAGVSGSKVLEVASLLGDVGGWRGDRMLVGLAERPVGDEEMDSNGLDSSHE